MMSSLASSRCATIACYHRCHPQIRTRCDRLPQQKRCDPARWCVWTGFIHEIQLNYVLQSMVANGGHRRQRVTALRPVKQLRHNSHKHDDHQHGSLPIFKIVTLPPCRGYHCALLCYTDDIVHGPASRAAETV